MRTFWPVNLQLLNEFGVNEMAIQEITVSGATDTLRDAEIPSTSDEMYYSLNNVSPQVDNVLPVCFPSRPGVHTSVIQVEMRAEAAKSSLYSL